MPQGQYLTQTPAFSISGVGNFNYIYLKLYNFPLLADKNFSIGYSWRSHTGTWYSYGAQQQHDFSLINFMKFNCYTDCAYGMFFITNLYGNPSPSYSYMVYGDII